MNIFLNQKKDFIEHRLIQIHLTRDNKCIIQAIPNKNKSKNGKIDQYFKKDNNIYEYDNSYNNISKNIPSEDSLMNLSITQNDINISTNNNNIKNNNLKNNSENSDNIVNFSELLDTTKSNNLKLISNSKLFTIKKREERDMSLKKNDSNISNISNLNSNQKIISINSDKKTPLKYLKAQFNNKNKVLRNNDYCFRKNLLNNFNDNSDFKEKNINPNDNENNVRHSSNICNENLNILNIIASLNNSKSNNSSNKKFLKTNNIEDNSNNKEEKKIIVNRLNSYRDYKNTKDNDNQNKDQLIRVTKKCNTNRILKVNNNNNNKKINNQNKKNDVKLSKSNSHHKMKAVNLTKNNSNYSMSLKTLNCSEITLNIKHNNHFDSENKKKLVNKISKNNITQKTFKKLSNDINKSNYKNYINMSENNTKRLRNKENNSNTETAIFNSNREKVRNKNSNNQSIKKRLSQNCQNLKKKINLTFNEYKYKKLKSMNKSLYKEKEKEKGIFAYIKNKSLNKNKSFRKALTFRSRNSELNNIVRNNSGGIKSTTINRDNNGKSKVNITKIIFKNNNNNNNSINERNKSFNNKNNKINKNLLKNMCQNIKKDYSKIKINPKILKSIENIHNTKNKTERINIKHFIQIPLFNIYDHSTINNIFTNKKTVNKNNYKENIDSNVFMSNNNLNFINNITHENSAESRNTPKLSQLNTFSYKSLNYLQYLKKPKEIINDFSKYKKKKDIL